MNDSACIKRIVSEIGEVPETAWLFMMLFPPVLLFAGFMTLTEMLEKVSPVVINEILESSTKEELNIIKPIICEKKGCLKKYDLWKMKNKLRKTHQEILENEALLNVKRICA